MSVSRILLIGFLVVMLVGTLAIGGVLVWKQFPGYWLNAASKAEEAGDYESAEINLKKLLHKDPNNTDAMLKLVEVLRDRKEDEGGSRFYAANPEAVGWLARAAELRPSDMELQKRMVRVYLSTGDLGKAAPIAEEVYKSEPTNPNAHFALTWKAVEQKDEAKAEKLFKQFENNEILTTRLFLTQALQQKYYHEAGDEEKASKVLADAAWRAQNLKDDDLGILLGQDRMAMLQLMLMHQQNTDDPQSALDRGKALIDTAKRLQRLELADQTALASIAANSIALFNLKFPSIKLEPTHRVLRDQLSMEAQSLGTSALEAAAKSDISAPMLVYWTTARSLMTRGEFDQALKIANDGIAAAQKLEERQQGGLLDLHLLAARALISQRRYEEADSHLDELLDNKRFEGWAHLLKGSVALKQDRLDLAHEEFLKAKGVWGDKILVQMSLAHTYMARKEWDKAIPLLEALNRPVEEYTDEERVWYEQLLGGGQRIHFDLLRAKLALGRWDDAQEDLLILKDGELAPNAWGVVVTYLWDEEKNKEKANAYIERVRARYPKNLGLAMLQARMLKEDGKTTEAAALMDRFASGNSEEITQLAYARWLIRNGDPQRALELLATVEQRPNLTPRAINTVLVYRVQALIGARRFDEAERQADELIAREGTATAGYLMKAALAFRVRDEKTGIEMLEKAREANPSNPALNMMVQRIKSSQGDYEGVLELAGNVAGIAKYQPQVQVTVGEALRKLADSQGPDAALEKVDELLKKQPNDLGLIVLKVDLLISLNRTPEAMTLLSTVQRDNPENLNIPRLKAQAWLAQDEPAKALEEIETATRMQQEQGVAEDEVDSSLLDMGAQAAIAAEEYDKARLYAVKLSRKEPDSPRGFLLVAETFRRQKDMRNAIGSLEYYAKRHPKDFAILKTLAGLHEENGDSAKALEVLKRASQGDGVDIRVTASQMELLLKAKPANVDQARLIAQEAVGSSQNADYLLLVANEFAKAGINLDAQNWGERALIVATPANKTKVHSFLGKIYLRRASEENNASFYDKARTQFKMVLETNPRDMVAGNNMAWLLATKFNDSAEAVKVAEQVRGNASLEQLPPAFIDTLIDAYQRNGQQEKARALAKDSVGLYPKESNLLYRYGILLASSEPLQAKQMLARAVQLGLSAEYEAEAKRQLQGL